VSKSDKTTAPAEPKRTGFVLNQAEGELGWVLREVELPESVIAEHTVRSWPAELLSIAYDNIEQRVSRKLVERLDT
jgi:hypothetical protein